jgi:hypothetical protein
LSAGLLLALAREILVEEIETFKEFHSRHWWAIRCLFVQQRVIENHSASIKERLCDLLNKTQEHITHFSNDTKALFYIEKSLIAQYYNQMDFEVREFYSSSFPYIYIGLHIDSHSSCSRINRISIRINWSSGKKNKISTATFRSINHKCIKSIS